MKLDMLFRTIPGWLLLVALFVSDGPKEILLWPDGAPGSEGKTGQEKVRIAESGDHVVSGINKPSITPFLPAAGKGATSGAGGNTVGAGCAAVIIAPGGGHAELWIDHEGYTPAKWLQARGIAAFVLKYRLSREPNSTYTIDGNEVADIHRAIRLVRSRAKEWGIDTSRIGVMGFSAGGEVAALSAMRFDEGRKDAADPIERQGCRPAFQALIYPGNSGRFEAVKGAPPVFLLGGYKDRADIAEGLARIYLKYKEAGIPAELHIYTDAGHGFGVRATNKGAVAGWLDRFMEWMGDMGMTGVASDRTATLAASDRPLARGSGERPGSFVMGSPLSETGRKADESPETEVTLTKGYWLGKTEVTIGQWKAVMGHGLRDQVIRLLNDDSVYDFGGQGLGATAAGPREAGEKSGNAWGLQDMYGNLWDGAADERSANRATNPQPEKSAYRGFRVALVQVRREDANAAR